MRINIDLPDDVAKFYNVQAAEFETDRKNLVQNVLVNLARGEKGTLKKLNNPKGKK